MRWLDRLLGREHPSLERYEDQRAIKELRVSFTKVHMRTDRLQKELERVNADLRRKVQAR